METESKPKINYTTEYIVGAGYLFFFCILLTACLGFFYLNRSLYLPAPPPANEFARNLPPLTPTPHISFPRDLQEDSLLFKENFNNNNNRWLNSKDDSKEKIQDGQLFFQSRDDGQNAILSCELCPDLKKPFYLETTLSTSAATDEGYGVIFNHSYTLEDYFLFMINPESRKYFLFHCAADGWTLRASGESNLIQPYPESTTLGIYASQDSLELYINGEIVDSYVESGTSFHSGFFGLYTYSSWFGVLADKIVIHEIGE